MTASFPSRSRRRLAFLVGLLVVVAGASWFQHTRPKGPATPPPANRENLLRALLALEAREAEAERTVWANEMVARRCGWVVEQLWDTVNSASNRLAALGTLECDAVIWPVFAPARDLPHGIRLFPPKDPSLRGPAMSHAAWRSWLAARQADGWRLEQIEFRHNRFECDEAARPVESAFGFRAQASRIDSAGTITERAALEGNLRVVWTSGGEAEEPPAVRVIDASRLILKTRPGPPGFRALPMQTVTPPPRSHFVDPLLLEDLDGDGRVEIVLASANRVFSLGRDGELQSREWSRVAPGLIFTAVLGDFDADGLVDRLTAKSDGLFLARGVVGGGFDAGANRAWAAPEPLRYVQTLTCGDVDGDGDLDVWLGQYKNPYDGGQMPTPFHDANDGNPAYLLLNNGHGGFTDGTANAGLATKRWRRTYAGSLVDLDADGDLDLVAVSDFAGVDLYANDGRGRFRDITADWLDDPKAFGMAHAFADFNADGRLDLFVTGMHCPTASRLEHLGLGRPERQDYLAMTPRMIRGNKLLLGRAGGGFDDVADVSGVARTGWSWGSAAADFDNDGWPDLAIANGHETRQSVVEYEPEFWLHDLYAADSQENPVAAQYFAAKINRLRGGGMSYGGWEQNRLFLNRGADGFVEVAHLLGVALGEDSRNLAVADLDGDGRLDLVLTTFEFWPERRQTLRVFRNELPLPGHWLGVQLRTAGQGSDPAGAQVTLHRTEGRVAVAVVVTGDSHRSQGPGRVHFGLGADPEVIAVEVRWPGGRIVRLEQPAVDRVHAISAGPAPR